MKNFNLVAWQTLNFLRHRRRGLPTVMGIELSTACNRTCSYCPQSIGQKPKQQIIAPTMWDKWTSRLREFDWRGAVGFTRYSEATLIPNFTEYVADLKAKVPACLPYLYSNGDRPEMLRAAFYAGLFRVVITQHENTDETKWLPPILDLKKEFGWRIKFHKISHYSNWAGALSHIKMEPFTECIEGGTGMGFNIDGHMFMCCSDPQLRTSLWGNLMNRSLHDIWFDPTYMRVRADLLKGVPHLKICHGCFGKTSFEEVYAEPPPIRTTQNAFGNMLGRK